MLSFFEGLNINSFTITRIEPETASAGIQTDIEQIASPEAVSESGPGTDLYTYIERREPKVTSQKSSPANTGPQSGAGRTLSSPKDGSSGIAGSQINQARRATVDHLQSGSGGFVQANTTSEMPFPPANPQPPDPLPGQVPLQRGFDHHLSTGTSDDPRPAEIVQLQMAGNAPQVQLYGPPSNPQTMSSEQSDVFRPMMDGFDTMSGMMGMDLNNEDDDLWWARSWGSVRIL
jgi:hypothetical protein